MDWKKDERWNARQEARRERYLDWLRVEHAEGYHDLPGDEVEECPACETRREDEEAAAQHYDPTCALCERGEEPGHEH